VGVWPGIFRFTQQILFTGKTRRRPNYLDRALQRSEGEITTETETSLGKEDDSDAAVEADEARRNFNRFKIPKLKKAKFWTRDQLENFRKNWLNIKNFTDSVLENATLSELTAMGKQKISGSRFLSHTLSANFEQLQNFPAKVEEGLDDCLGKAHHSRFLRGYVRDSQELWRQARDEWGANGIEPIANYEVGSIGLGELLTHKVWAELHKPNSRQLSMRLLSPKSAEEAWKDDEKTDSPKDFENLHEFKMAIVTLEGGFHRVMPWNFSFKALSFFLNSINFGESELSNRTGRLQFLSNFVDEVLRTNARNWEERKPFLSFQDLSVKWSSDLIRKLGSLPSSNETGNKRNGKSRLDKKEKSSPRVPRWVCRRFNERRCEQKEDRHVSSWDPNFFLKHVCSKWFPNKNRCCLESHPLNEHK
jgi:hypothetical protein